VGVADAAGFLASGEGYLEVESADEAAHRANLMAPTVLIGREQAVFKLSGLQPQHKYEEAINKAILGSM
jgi:hypothetical protein